MNVQVRYVIFQIPETGFYTFYDAFAPRPMRSVHDDEIICFASTLTAANLVVDSLNALGYV